MGARKGAAGGGLRGWWKEDLAAPQEECLLGRRIFEGNEEKEPGEEYFHKLFLGCGASPLFLFKIREFSARH